MRCKQCDREFYFCASCDFDKNKTGYCCEVCALEAKDYPELVTEVRLEVNPHENNSLIHSDAKVIGNVIRHVMVEASLEEYKNKTSEVLTINWTKKYVYFMEPYIRISKVVIWDFPLA